MSSYVVTIRHGIHAHARELVLCVRANKRQDAKDRALGYLYCKHPESNYIRILSIARAYCSSGRSLIAPSRDGDSTIAREVSHVSL